MATYATPYGNPYAIQQSQLLGPYASTEKLLAANTRQYGLPAHALGLQELYRLLSNQGRTDPTAMNMMLSSVDRGTQSQQDAINARMARSGLSSSGVGAALQAATGQAGQARKASIRAADAAAADQNQRMNLQLLQELVLGPGFNLAGMDIQRRQQKQGQRAALIGGLASLLGAFSGGPAGAAAGGAIGNQISG